METLQANNKLTYEFYLGDDADDPLDGVVLPNSIFGYTAFY